MRDTESVKLKHAFFSCLAFFVCVVLSFRLVWAYSGSFSQRTPTPSSTNFLFPRKEMCLLGFAKGHVSVQDNSSVETFLMASIRGRGQGLQG